MARARTSRREEMSEPSSFEKTHLETHVELCALRYSALETKLADIENKVSDLSKSLKSSYNSTTKVLIATAGTVVASVLSTLIIILTRVH